MATADYRDTLPRERAGHDPAPWRMKPNSPAARMAAKGRDGDTLVAHINRDEADMLKAAGGRGTVNPKTGAIEFAQAGNFDAALYLAQNPDVAAAGADPWQHYEQHGRNEGRVGNAEEVAARAEGYGGTFGSGGYVDWKNQQSQAVTPLPTMEPERPRNGALNDYLDSQLAEIDSSAFDGQGGFWAEIDRQGLPRHYIEGLISGFTQNFDPVTGVALRPDAQGNIYGGSALAPHGMYDASGRNGVGNSQTPGGVIPGTPQPSGATGVPSNPGNSYTPRNYGGNVRNATPAGLAAYYQSQGMGQRPYGTVGGEHNFFPNRSYELPEIIGVEDEADDGGTGG